MTGLMVLGVVLALAMAAAVALRLVNGRFRRQVGRDRLTAEEIGSALGSRATVVQFSSAFCSPCRATRTLLRDVTGKMDDVVYAEVDAESHLELVRRLNVLRTPTVVVLDASGAVVRQASGLPRRDQVEAVIASV